MPLLHLSRITVSGTPEELGRAHGMALRDPIRGFVDQRGRAARAYLRERGIRDADALTAIARGCLDALRAWDEAGWIEHQATADAAGVDAIELYAAGNHTDVRDVLALGETGPTAGGGAAHADGSSHADGEGCSAVLVPGSHSADGALIAAQTWDLNPTDLDYVVAINRRPAQGPETWSITCAGCPSLIGMNAHGVAVGTTNIKTHGSRLGIPYLSLLHRAIRCRTRGEALDVIAAAPRAAAHTYWAADAHGAGDLECTATSWVRREAASQPLWRTNHCLDDAHRGHEGEPPSASSRARYARVGAWLAAGGQDASSLKRLFADRSDGVDSVNRYAEDGQGTSTDACVIAVPARRELHACRGSADRGEWVRLAFPG